MTFPVFPAIFVPDDYRKPAELIAVGSGFGRVAGPLERDDGERGIFLPLHRDDITPRSTRASRNQGR